MRALRRHTGEYIQRRARGALYAYMFRLGTAPRYTRGARTTAGKNGATLLQEDRRICRFPFMPMLQDSSLPPEGMARVHVARFCFSRDIYAFPPPRQRAAARFPR